MAGSRKTTPPSIELIRSLNIDSDLGLEYVRLEVNSVVDSIRYVGDLEQLATRYGLHYLQVKRMRRRELSEWIKNNHPAVKECLERKSPKDL